MKLKKYTPEEIESLRRALSSRKGDVISFESEPILASAITSLGIAREVKTISNELEGYIFNEDTQTAVPNEAFRSEIVQMDGHVGVRVWAEGITNLEIRLAGFKNLITPQFSYNGTSLRQLVIFPEIVAQILATNGVNLVVVPEWGLNTIFGGFDSSKHYYQTNFWELENNDTLRFAKLLEAKRLPFLGTHDLAAHLSGVKEAEVSQLSQRSSEVVKALESYFEGVSQKSKASLILPYIAGVLLDDLAQPLQYRSAKREHMLSLLLDEITHETIDAAERRRLIWFPKGFSEIISFTRENTDEEVFLNGAKKVQQLLHEIRLGSNLSHL